MSVFTKMISAAAAICILAGVGITAPSHVLAEGNEVTGETPLDVRGITPGRDVVLDSGEDVYRLFNPANGEHLFTSNVGEMNFLRSAGWRYEGVAFRAIVHSDVPVYRLYNPYTGDHLFTASGSERTQLVSAGWRDEGVAFYGSSVYGVPQFRLYNPYTRVGSHFYTSSAAERDSLVRAGWRYEGIAFYTLR